MATFEETIDKAVQAAVKRALLDAHPVGSIYLTIKDDNPSAKFGGTWEKLPSSVCLQTADTTHGAGTTIAAGLPNIMGQYGVHWGVINPAKNNGCFKANTDLATAPVGAQDGQGAQTGTFDASRSSAIYGKSTTVQPPAYALIAWRRTA